MEGNVSFGIRDRQDILCLHTHQAENVLDDARIYLHKRIFRTSSRAAAAAAAARCSPDQSVVSHARMGLREKVGTNTTFEP